MAKPKARKPSEQPTLDFIYREARNGERGLFPVTEFDHDMLSRHRKDARIKAKIEEPRDDVTERLYFAVVNKTAKAKGIDPGLLHWRLKNACGKVHRYIIEAGRVDVVPMSITEMGQAEFSEYVNAAFTEITTAPDLLPGTTIKEILDMGRKYIGETGKDLPL